MKSDAPPPTGFIGTLQALGDNLFAAMQERLELIAVELHEEKVRLVQTFIWIGAVMFTGMLALTFGSLLLLYCFWDSARLGVLGGLAAFYTGALVMVIVAFRRFLVRQPIPFAASREELTEDRACIRAKS